MLFLYSNTKEDDYKLVKLIFCRRSSTIIQSNNLIKDHERDLCFDAKIPWAYMWIIISLDKFIGLRVITSLTNHSLSQVADAFSRLKLIITFGFKTEVEKKTFLISHRWIVEDFFCFIMFLLCSSGSKNQKFGKKRGNLKLIMSLLLKIFLLIL